MTDIFQTDLREMRVMGKAKCSCCYGEAKPDEDGELFEFEGETVCERCWESICEDGEIRMQEQNWR